VERSHLEHRLHQRARRLHVDRGRHPVHLRQEPPRVDGVLQHLVGHGHAERTGGEGQGVSVGEDQRAIDDEGSLTLGVTQVGVDEHVGARMRGVTAADFEHRPAISGHASIPPPRRRSSPWYHAPLNGRGTAHRG